MVHNILQLPPKTLTSLHIVSVVTSIVVTKKCNHVGMSQEMRQVFEPWQNILSRCYPSLFIRHKTEGIHENNVRSLAKLRLRFINKIPAYIKNQPRVCIFTVIPQYLNPSA